MKGGDIMSTYKLCLSLIKKGSKVVTAEKLDVFLLAGRITEDEYMELLELLNANKTEDTTEDK